MRSSILVFKSVLCCFVIFLSLLYSSSKVCWWTCREISCLKTTFPSSSSDDCMEKRFTGNDPSILMSLIEDVTMTLSGPKTQHSKKPKDNFCITKRFYVNLSSKPKKCWFLPTGSHSTESPCLHRGPSRNQFPWHPRTVLISCGGRKSLSTVVRLLAGSAVWWAVRYPRPSGLLVPRVPGTLRWQVSLRHWMTWSVAVTRKYLHWHWSSSRYIVSPSHRSLYIYCVASILSSRGRLMLCDLMCLPYVCWLVFDTLVYCD